MTTCIVAMDRYPMYANVGHPVVTNRYAVMRPLLLLQYISVACYKYSDSLLRTASIVKSTHVSFAATPYCGHL